MTELAEVDVVLRLPSLARSYTHRFKSFPPDFIRLPLLSHQDFEFVQLFANPLGLGFVHHRVLVKLCSQPEGHLTLSADKGPFLLILLKLGPSHLFRLVCGMPWDAIPIPWASGGIRFAKDNDG